jgi:hypothetical protein
MHLLHLGFASSHLIRRIRQVLHPVLTLAAHRLLRWFFWGGHGPAISGLDLCGNPTMMMSLSRPTL